MIAVGREKYLALKNTSTESATYLRSGSALSAKKSTQARENLRITDTMDKQFQISYKVEGVRVINVWLPEGVELPPIWSAMTPAHQDEWLYSHQARSEVSYEDIHHSEAENVLQVRHLRAI